ncbi:MAG: Stp1/IreP family PP2C-type Ser/Thr phosphatase, partial [Anaerolineae bacterium]
MQKTNPERDTVIPMGGGLPEEEQTAAVVALEPGLEVGLASDIGPTRRLNEDYADFCIPQDPVLACAKGAIFVLADGMGGHQAGDIASRQAVALVLEGYYGDPAAQPADRLVRAIKIANRSLYEEALSDPAKSGMGTTLVAAVVLGQKIYVANVGDSRAYLISKQGIVQITTDHSWVEEQLRAGLLTREQVRHHPHRHLVTRALGSKPSVEVDLFEAEISAGDSILLCSDGLIGRVEDAEIATTVQQYAPEEAARHLVAQASERGGSDNITVLIVTAGKAPSLGIPA